MTNTLFSDLELLPKVERAVKAMGFEIATPVQSAAIPVIRTGSDVIVKSQTGTGKTIAFAIPAIEAIDTHEEKATIQVLVLCPTRELAQQADEEIKKLSRFKPGIKSLSVYGGAPIQKQCIRLRSANIVIGTPGRVMDHMRRKTIKLNSLKMIVLDEADEMLNMGFINDIETILTDTPEDRQTVMFSATMPPSIIKLAEKFQKDAELIEIDKSKVTIENIEQKYIDVAHERKADALILLVSHYQAKKTIVFCNTKKMTDELSEKLTKAGFLTGTLHSDIKQTQRTATLSAFKTGRLDILIATDIAARGIDVNDVETVINYDVPQNSEYYIHRIGRTGRAGKSGRSITICSGKREVLEMRSVAVDVKSEISQFILPSSESLKNEHIDKAVEKVLSVIDNELHPAYEKIVFSLVGKGYSIEKIAAASMLIAFEDLEQKLGEAPILQKIHDDLSPEKPMLTKNKNKNQKKKRIDGSCSVIIKVGTKHKVSPNHIVGALTDLTSLTGSDIGKIKIMNEQTVVDIKTSDIESVIKAMRGCRICGFYAKAEAAEKNGVIENSSEEMKKQLNTQKREKFSSNGSKEQKHRRV